MEVIIMNKFGINEIIQGYKEKLARKQRILANDFQPAIENGDDLTEKQYRDKEVLLAEISLIKLILDDLDYIQNKPPI